MQRLVKSLCVAGELAPFRQSVVPILGTPADNLATEYHSAGIAVKSCPLLWPTRLPRRPHRLMRFARNLGKASFPWRLTRLLKALQADALHSHLTLLIDWQARVALDSVGIPMVWTIHGDYKPEGEELRRWEKAVQMGRGARRLKIVAVSKAVRCDISKRLSHPEEDISVVYSGVDIGRFSQPRVCGVGTRDNPWSFPPKSVVFGSAGRLVEEKAYDIFIGAAALVAKANSLARFVIAGDGPLRSALLCQIQKLGLGGRFVLDGFHPDIPAFLRELDVFVLSSRREGLGMALVEALAAGLPCIGTETGGIPEILNAQAGILVPADSVTGLFEAMRQMFDKKLRDSCAAAAPLERLVLNSRLQKSDASLLVRCHKMAASGVIRVRILQQDERAPRRRCARRDACDCH